MKGEDLELDLLSVAEGVLVRQLTKVNSLILPQSFSFVQKSRQVGGKEIGLLLILGLDYGWNEGGITEHQQVHRPKGRLSC